MTEYVSLGWLIASFLLIILEIVIPGGFILLFFGMGAFTLSILTYFFDLGWLAQMGLFSLGSVMYLFLLRENVQRLFRSRNIEDPENEFIGKTAKTLTAVSSEEGKVEFKGTQWPAISLDKIPAGEEVEIVGQESITLYVKPLK